MTKQPSPGKSSNIQPSDEQGRLVESLARTVHEQWVQERRADGWTSGRRRNVRVRTDPALVRYDELDPATAEQRRLAARGALEALQALGYRIEALSTEPEKSELATVGARLSQPSSNLAPSNQASELVGLDLNAVVIAQDARSPSAESNSPAASRELAERLGAAGEPLLAYDVIHGALEHWPDDLRLRQLLGLALADSGATERANAILAQLVSEGHEDEETLGKLARTHKDLWQRACDEPERKKHLGLAQEWYTRAYQQTGGYWTGINAATLASLRGDPSAGTAAEEVYRRCRMELRGAEQGADDRYWLLATLGEACLILARWSEAQEWYEHAAEAGRGRIRDLSSTRRNARLLLNRPAVQEKVRVRIEACFRIPPVVMFTGHMVDRADRPWPRFPPKLESTVAAAIRQRLDAGGTPIAFSSAACGADLLFLEAVLDMGGEVNVVIPYDIPQFEADSVAARPDGEWSARFHRILDRAAQVTIGSERCATPGSAVYAYGNLLLRGLATIRADQLDAELRGMAVWDGRPGDGPGGTASVVQAWQRSGVPTEIVDLGELVPQRGERAARLDRPPTGDGPTAKHEMDGIKAMLFGDAAGFSRLSDEQVPVFVNEFLGTVGALSAQATEGPVMQNTWGDGIFFVFDRPAAAGRFALDLCDAVAASDWTALGLPPEMSLRIGLHAGPVYQYVDPITHLVNYSGAHVSRAARIEPIAPPGQVYASEAFAALCAAEGTEELVCEYVGQTPLAKGYGTFRMYHLRRRPC